MWVSLAALSPNAATGAVVCPSNLILLNFLSQREAHWQPARDTLWTYMKWIWTLAAKEVLTCSPFKKELAVLMQGVLELRAPSCWTFEIFNSAEGEAMLLWQPPANCWAWWGSEGLAISAQNRSPVNRRICSRAHVGLALSDLHEFGVSPCLVLLHFFAFSRCQNSTTVWRLPPQSGSLPIDLSQALLLNTFLACPTLAQCLLPRLTQMVKEYETQDARIQFCHPIPIQD